MTDQEIRVLKASGKTYRQIADVLGVSRQRVQQRLRVKSKRPDACQRCGAKGKLHGHHLDYITDDHQWLCPSCHKIVECIEAINRGLESPIDVKCEVCDWCGGYGVIPAIESLVEIRISCGISQQEIAKRMGISNAYLCDIEKGRRKINHSRCEQYLDACKQQPTKGQ